MHSRYSIKNYTEPVLVDNFSMMRSFQDGLSSISAPRFLLLLLFFFFFFIVIIIVVITVIVIIIQCYFNYIFIITIVSIKAR